MIEEIKKQQEFVDVLSAKMDLVNIKTTAWIPGGFIIKIVKDDKFAQFAINMSYLLEVGIPNYTERIKAEILKAFEQLDKEKNENDNK